MEEKLSEIRGFLYDCDELLSPGANINPKIVGNYALNRQDVAAQVIDWVLHYLEDRKCPYNLAIAVAKETAQQIDNRISEQQLKEENAFVSEKSLNSLALYNEAVRGLASVCRSFMDKVNESELSSPSPTYSASVFAIKNKRRKMEDRHVIHHDLNLLLDIKNAPAHSYYAVFDGHSGIDAASYASAHLHLNIANHPAFLTDTPAAITEAYRITDDNFLRKCQEENLKSGTTAVCALFREKTCFLSWLGDSQAVLVEEGKPLIVTSPHKPEREDERKRIEDLGGCITCNDTYRVNGMLAVTRAIGDGDHKPYISSEPEVKVVNLNGTEDFLILACDGLWDGMSPEDVIAALYYNLMQSDLNEPLDTIAAKLVHQSKLQGSEDNITAVVIFLRDIKSIKEDAMKYVPNLSKTNLEMNFLIMNGEEKQFSDISPITPACKPTVLELNNSSTNKLQNTANVLSAAGLGESSFSCSFSENTEYFSCNTSNIDHTTFSHKQNASSCIAPETTALSELPTPPIDDVLASQQFDKINSVEFARELDSVAPRKLLSEDSNDYPVTALDNNSNFHTAEVSQVSNSSESSFKEIGQVSTKSLSPDEAVDIASCVVSNAIETAVKCLSGNEPSESVMHISAQKLNPFAEPFVMKSFVSEDTEIKESIDIKLTNLEQFSMNHKEDTIEANSKITCPIATEWSNITDTEDFLIKSEQKESDLMASTTPQPNFCDKSLEDNVQSPILLDEEKLNKDLCMFEGTERKIDDSIFVDSSTCNQRNMKHEIESVSLPKTPTNQDIKLIHFSTDSEAGTNPNTEIDCIKPITTEADNNLVIKTSAIPEPLILHELHKNENLEDVCLLSCSLSEVSRNLLIQMKIC